MFGTAIRRRLVSLALGLTIIGTGVVGGVLMAGPAQAAAPASGVVAVHNGSWGYQEVVFGKATTQRLATSPVWDLSGILAGVAPAAVPAAVYVYLIGYEARQAVASGQCFASVRMVWGTPFFPGKESWGCR
jgi:urea transporter